MPHAIPLFPLDVVLFPGAPLPLHIFEPRYRRLLADVLEGDRRFAIVPPGADGGAPAPGAVGCVAEVRAVQGLPDGRSNIVVVGGARVTVVGAADASRAYAVAAVEEFDDAADTLPEAQMTDALRARFARWLALVREVSAVAGIVPDLDPALPADARALSLLAAGLVPCPDDLKRRMLAMRSTSERVALLLALFPLLIANAESGRDTQTRARANGRGAHHPDIAEAEEA
ncbi:MAG TPA: LON peptidase substrate-binding domain-containing protein [Gemmatimonadales bacterium]|nr:LON peptidase substrate-binding domain-containing protein [Gemmatimonadales bacterium]